MCYIPPLIKSMSSESIICVPSGIAYNHHMHLTDYDYDLKCCVSESLVSTFENPAVGIL